jgi:hypothetical protein
MGALSVPKGNRLGVAGFLRIARPVPEPLILGRLDAGTPRECRLADLKPLNAAFV